MNAFQVQVQIDLSRFKQFIHGYLIVNLFQVIFVFKSRVSGKQCIKSCFIVCVACRIPVCYPALRFRTPCR
jgi:hypothetical protein